MGFNLHKVVPWGRSFTEYCAMFTLNKQDLQRSIVGVGDGPAAFNAVLSKQNGQIISADPVYQFNATQIHQRIDDLFEDMLQQVAANANSLRLDKFSSIKQLGQIRMTAMSLFLQDFELGKRQGRYLNTELPNLNFRDSQFDLALCSHLLFLYSEQLNLDFHVKSVMELCRIAKEVRIFPLHDLSHQRSEHLNFVIQALTDAGFITSIEDVDYEFQKGANQMLRILS